MYCFASAYIANAGHFHGETAEHYWAESNQLGAQTRQMNNGHRQDTLIDHHRDWNWKKTAIMCAKRHSIITCRETKFSLAASLYTDITNAKMLFVQKRDHFHGLSAIYANRVAIWNKDDRQRRFLNKRKEIECVYRHNPGKGWSSHLQTNILICLHSKLPVPSQATIYQFLLGTENAAEHIASNLPSFGRETMPGHGSEITGAAFLNEALYIQSLQ